MSSPASGFRALPDGRDLPEALAEAFPSTSGWILATGYIEEVELRVAAQGGDGRQVLRGRYVLANLSGPVAGPYGVTLSRLENGRIEVLAGILVRARSAGVNACCLAASAESAVATPHEAAAGPVPAPLPVPAPAASAATAPRWASQATAAAARLAASEPEEANEEPEPSDLVEHFAFGVCEVVGVKGDRLLIRDKARGGRVLEIHLDMLVVHPPVQRDGKRLFRLSRRG